MKGSDPESDQEPNEDQDLFFCNFLGQCASCQLLDDALHVSQIKEAFLLPKRFDWKVMLPC